MYLLGEGVEKDIQRGIQLVETATNNGSQDAEEFYVDILLTGHFKIKRDPERAAYLYLKSFRAGNSRAALGLATALMQKRLKSSTLSKALLKLAADLGVREARKILKPDR